MAIAKSKESTRSEYYLQWISYKGIATVYNTREYWRIQRLLLDIITYVNTIYVSIEFTKPVEAMKSDSPKVREETDVVTATVNPSNSKGTGNGAKDKKQVAVKSVSCPKLEGEDLV